MDITPVINTLSQDLARAAHVGGEDVQEAAERLLLALDPALRLALLDALSQAANEIAAELPGVAISVRMEGREPIFQVQAPEPGLAEPAPAAMAGAVEADPSEDGDAQARITLRIPEALKARAEALATRRGQSLNTWLVAAARAAAQDEPNPPGSSPHRHGPGRRVQGWAR
ncbi:MAG: toxin-antitoxin system HicB family antitoxin [Proteobacteria bacterium]|nr:toxin-antitoxin system HicB family antitoxin [Pseudomonadota bacterium]